MKTNHISNSQLQFTGNDFDASINTFTGMLAECLRKIKMLTFNKYYSVYEKCQERACCTTVGHQMETMTILLNGSEINKWMKQRTKVGILTSVSRTVRFIFQKHVEIFG